MADLGKQRSTAVHGMVSPGAPSSGDRHGEAVAVATPLHPAWMPDRGLMGETTDWITAQPAWWLRWSPAATFTLVVVLIVVAWFVRVPDAKVLPVTIVTEESDDPPTVLNLYVPVLDGSLPPGRAVLRITAGPGAPTSRVVGRIERIAPAPAGTMIVFRPEVSGHRQGNGQILVPTATIGFGELMLQRMRSRSGL